MLGDQDKPPYKEAPDESTAEDGQEIADVHGHDRQHAADTD